MIKLCVQDYCQECTNFEAEVTIAHKMYSTDGVPVAISDTIIRCEHAGLCARLQKEFERMSKEKENGTCKEM